MWVACDAGDVVQCGLKTQNIVDLAPPVRGNGLFILLIQLIPLIETACSSCSSSSSRLLKRPAHPAHLAHPTHCNGLLLLFIHLTLQWPVHPAHPVKRPRTAAFAKAVDDWHKAVASMPATNGIREW